MTSEGRPRARLGMQARAALSSAIVATLIATGLAVVTYVSVRSFLIAQRDTTIEREAFANVRAIADELRSDPSQADRLAASLRTEAGAVVLLRVGDRWVSSPIGAGPDALPASLLRALDQGTARSCASRAEAGGGAVVALSGAALGVWSTRRALRPLRATSRAAQRLAAGDLEARLVPDPDPDLDRLTTAFNDMADALTRRIAQETRFASDVSQAPDPRGDDPGSHRRAAPTTRRAERAWA